jgi:hypothetical protein
MASIRITPVPRHGSRLLAHVRMRFSVGTGGIRYSFSEFLGLGGGRTGDVGYSHSVARTPLGIALIPVGFRPDGVCGRRKGLSSPQLRLIVTVSVSLTGNTSLSGTPPPRLRFEP